MTKLEEAEALGRGTMRGRVCRDDVEVLVKELDRLRGIVDRQNALISGMGNFIAKERGTAFLHADTPPTVEAVTWIGELRAELAALKGEAIRIGYVQASDASEATGWLISHLVDSPEQARCDDIDGEHIYEVRISARKVQT